jgi:hypothetical protein
MAKKSSLLDLVPSADAVRARLAKAISEARQLGILLQTAELIERAGVTEEDLVGVDVEDLLPKETRRDQ